MVLVCDGGGGFVTIFCDVEFVQLYDDGFV